MFLKLILVRDNLQRSQEIELRWIIFKQQYLIVGKKVVVIDLCSLDKCIFLFFHTSQFSFLVLL